VWIEARGMPRASIHTQIPIEPLFLAVRKAVHLL